LNKPPVCKRLKGQKGMTR